MAKSARRRAMPKTPQAQPRTPAETEPPTPVGGRSDDPARAQPTAKDSGSTAKAGKAGRSEPEYLLRGTGCTAGHTKGSELDGGRIGKLPTKRQARIGLALVVWCLGGMGALALAGTFDPRWVQFGIQIALLWLAFAAVLIRRRGHRGKCWRTRSWRQAWGGLAPGGGLDPTRPAGS